MNGKALMSGVSITELEASEMMNVLHFIFEEDVRYSSENEIAAKSAVREMMYQRFYGREYPYKYTPPPKAKEKMSYEDYEEADYDPDDPYGIKTASSFTPFDPADAGDPEFTHKGFVPSTNFDAAAPNPFDGILDAPAN